MPPRLFVLMFTDLVDSSSLKSELGNDDYVNFIARPHNRLFREILARFPDARENNYTGDGFLATFDSVSDAVNAALLFHHALRSFDWQRTQPMTRIGIHLGDSILFSGRDENQPALAGHAADMCARVMSLGAGGQTLLTRAVYDSALQSVRQHPDTGDGSAIPELRWLSHGQYLLKGSNDPVDVFEVGAAGIAPLTAPEGAEKAQRATPFGTTVSMPADEADVAGDQPDCIGRYRIEKVLGKGGFGLVYLAHDDQLDRRVAVKVPHARLVSRKADAEAYLTEARTVARLDHPHIVPVYDVGSTDEFPCYIVSKYIEGTDLARRLNQSRPHHGEAAELIATVAEALHYAHKQGVVHRDVSSRNILVGTDGKPFVVDFGLALREERIGKGPRYAGTPAYMSPEQARGEGHRVDGRSDVYSLGTVFYEALTGRRPFQGESKSEILDQIASQDPRPPRQVVDGIPRELERICLKALSRRASERYLTALDMAEDLRLFLADHPAVATNSMAAAAEAQPAAKSTHVPADTGTAESDSEPIRIVPKGLRSFDAHDADFFLELLPGPRDREGLPDSIRFWKIRIEETDPDNTFPVGLIYGPSGCGKSSLVKAGLLPRLSEEVIPVYVEATPAETETRLLHGLRKRCPALADNLNLKDTLAALRRGEGVPVGRKVLIVLDQFEQWLHARREEENTDLVQALRQCDGGQVQCIVMVRDDFWMAATRFMRELEIRLVEAQNSAAIDLFPVRHAEKVLAAFGRAFGVLSEDASQTTREQGDFLKQSAAGLSQEGKVICVRLALFAEMMKGKPWTPGTLKEVGGTTGIGVTFLEETFSASTAPPEHRYHQKAARVVLKELLPDSGTNIKGHMRSYAELLEASGYTSRPKDFDDLIRILDSEIRLITPTDPEGMELDDDSISRIEAGEKYYQLTHDYLVHSLRDWLTRKQRETRRGRAELRLAERSTAWNARPENRNLPSWWEHVSIRLFTGRKKWTHPQRKMMRRAGRVHGVRSLLIVLALTGLVSGGVALNQVAIRRQNDAEATRLVDGLLAADTAQVAAIIDELDRYKTWADDDLTAAFSESPDNSNAKLHAALALLPDDAALRFLKERMLRVSPQQFSAVRDLLFEHRQQLSESAWPELIEYYWTVATDQGDKPAEPARRFQAACALAGFDPENASWEEEELTRFVAEHLTGVQPSALLPWRDALQPVQQHLRGPLTTIYLGRGEGKDFAADVLSAYLSADSQRLFELLVAADAAQFGPIFDSLDAHQERAIELGRAEIALTPAEDASEDDREALALGQANAAVMLLRMGASDAVWPLLRHSPDPQVRSEIIHRLSPLGADPGAIIERYGEETDVTIQRALLLSLGEFDEARISQSEREAFSETLLSDYRTHPDAGLHAAAQWLLRRWGQAEHIAAMDIDLWQNEEQLRANPDEPRGWYVNSQGQTFVILDAGEFRMGSPESEAGRFGDEDLHRRQIERRFAICTTEVTQAQWRACPELNDVWPADQEQLETYIHSDDSPMIAMTWYEAAWYCNWLSEQEGIPAEEWCYEPNEQGEYGPGMAAKEGFVKLTGYRLPTEAEWEFACRAGAETSRYYGESEALLPQYVWYIVNGDNHAWPVGSLKPNDFGLFDMLGNAYEWCYDAYDDYPLLEELVHDSPPSDAVLDDFRRVLRGGSFSNNALNVRSAYRSANDPAVRDYFNGFRVARTYP